MTNIAVKVCLKEGNKDIPTLLLRLKELSFTRAQLKDDTNRDDLQNLLDGKDLKIGQISVHLMKDRILNP
jgi:hypothetical protein